ncbi:MAG: bifunctional diguanylate cyclase/phosphodiesterase [Hyphomicrobiales bacterium]|nr:bifunctional diguanylate cyclase/phosphodiesterase [Hyphomicrobiales bacterium]
MWEFNVERAENAILGIDDNSTFLFAAIYTDDGLFAAHGDNALVKDARNFFQSGQVTQIGQGSYHISENRLFVSYPIVLVSRAQELGLIVAAFSLEEMHTETGQIEQKVQIVAAGGTLFVLLGMLTLAWLANRWLGRVAVGITNVANGDLRDNVNLSSSISEFQDIHEALRQLRRDALQLIELKSKSRAAEQIRYMALNDPLTNLGNRRYLDEYMAGFQHPDADGSGVLEVLHIDLDGFKEVNDTAGHAAGDAVLEMTSKRLREAVSDTGKTFRVGGDEFVIVRHHNTIAGDGGWEPTALAEDITRIMSEPCIVDGQTHPIGASVGLVITSASHIEKDKILADADIAMYAAKAAGKNCFTQFTSELRDASVKRLHLATNLEGALERGEIVAYYQPKVTSQGFKIFGAEALVRWRDPAQGVLTPDKFLDIAKERRLIAKIDRMVFHRVCEDLAAWRAQGLEAPKVSINVSASRLADPDLLEELKAADLEPGSISFELLETVYHEDAAEDVILRLNLIRSLGVQIELDDFGSEHASMMSLLRIAPDRLKIDRRFVQDMLVNQQSAWLISQMVEIGKSLGIAATAEGVESLAQATALQEIGCDMLQGYHFGKPCAPDEFAQRYLKARPSHMEDADLEDNTNLKIRAYAG